MVTMPVASPERVAPRPGSRDCQALDMPDILANAWGMELLVAGAESGRLCTSRLTFGLEGMCRARSPARVALGATRDIGLRPLTP